MRLKSNPYPFKDVIKLNNDIDQTFARPSPSTGAASSGREGTTMNPGGDVDDFSNGTLLARTLAVMPNVKKIHIKFGEYPFQDLSLASQWNRMEKMDGLVEARSTIQDQPLAVRSYSSILMGANAATLPFTSLQMDSMPVRCFVPPDETHAASPLNHLASMRNAVQYVQELDVKFSGCFLDYTHPESLTIPHNLALFLGSVPLQSLDLRWGDSFYDWGHLDSIDTTPRLLYLSSPFYDLTFPHLTTLRISHMAQATHMTPTLYRFLIRHSMLKRLHINSIVRPCSSNDYHPTEVRCVWKQTLYKLRDTLKLEKFQLLLFGEQALVMCGGKMVYVFEQSDRGEHEIYNSEWNEVEGRERSATKQLERFVLGFEDEPWVPSMDHVHELCPLVRAENNGTYNDGDLAQRQRARNQAIDGSDDWAEAWS